jgi:transposase
MTETLTLITERVDDIPVLFEQMQKLEMAQQIDKHLSSHGNRKGLSYGVLACVWLTHIISQADHRMNQVRQWAAQRTNTLQSLMLMVGAQNHTWVETDFTDDRLADLLKALSDDTKWELLQSDINSKSIATGCANFSDGISSYLRQITSQNEIEITSQIEGCNLCFNTTINTNVCFYQHISQVKAIRQNGKEAFNGTANLVE